jgi:hypothetical protein
MPTHVKISIEPGIRELFLKETIQPQIKVKEQYFYCCSTFQSHSRILNNEYKSYLK